MSGDGQSRGPLGGSGGHEAPAGAGGPVWSEHALARSVTRLGVEGPQGFLLVESGAHVLEAGVPRVVAPLVRDGATLGWAVLAPAREGGWVVRTVVTEALRQERLAVGRWVQVEAAKRWRVSALGQDGMLVFFGRGPKATARAAEWAGRGLSVVMELAG